MNLYNKIQSVLDIKSGTIIGLWSLGMLSGSIYSIVTTGLVSVPIASMFSVVITAFAGTKIAEHISKGVKK